MPTVVNGIGTWYYGKRRIHRAKGACEFCRGVGELESFDTTLYFVVFFVPLVPLGSKRIIAQCPYCQKHRVARLKDWEANKAKALAEVMERLDRNPDDRESIQAALGTAVAFQDEVLFDKMAAALASHRQDDAEIQAQLGAAYNYFSRRQEAAVALATALAARDDPEVREQLGWTLLKLGRPDDAAPHLEHILTQKQKDNVGLIYLLAEAYQAKGEHAKALAVMDRRDEAFPDLAGLKEYQAQRKISEKHRASGKAVPSKLLQESSRVGYREGGGLAALVPKLIGPVIAAGLLVWYLATCVWIGQARKVYLVNGTGRPYTVLVNGQPHSLPPVGTAVAHVAEGEVSVEPGDGAAPLPPTKVRVESNFFARPFFNKTFALNPDRLAIIYWEEGVYGANPPPSPPAKPYVGETLYAFDGIDYEFTEFPLTLEVSEGSTVRKTRVFVSNNLNTIARMGVAESALGPGPFLDYLKRYVEWRPDDVTALHGLLARLPEAERLPFLETGLAARPVRVEWHRGYQSLTERAKPDRDLRPEYRKLVEETGRHPDAVYLLGRIEDLDTGEKLLKEAATASPPSKHALHALGFRAMARADFADAVQWLEKGTQAAPNDQELRHDFREALLAAGEYDRLIKSVEQARQESGGVWDGLPELIRANVAKGDQAGVDAALAQVNALPGGQGADAQLKAMLRPLLEAVRCAAGGDVEGFIKQVEAVPQFPKFEPMFLQRKYAAAAGVTVTAGQELYPAQQGLLYLAGRRTMNQKVADEAWKNLTEALAKADRHSRRFGELLGGQQPPDVKQLRRLPVAPLQKRVLMAVAAERFPDQADELLALARQLDFHRDGTSLCLRQILK